MCRTVMATLLFTLPATKEMPPSTASLKLASMHPLPTSTGTLPRPAAYARLEQALIEAEDAGTRSSSRHTNCKALSPITPLPCCFACKAVLLEVSPCRAWCCCLRQLVTLRKKMRKPPSFTPWSPTSWAQSRTFFGRCWACLNHLRTRCGDVAMVGRNCRLELEEERDLRIDNEVGGNEFASRKVELWRVWESI